MYDLIFEVLTLDLYSQILSHFVFIFMIYSAEHIALRVWHQNQKIKSYKIKLMTMVDSFVSFSAEMNRKLQYSYNKLLVQKHGCIK